MAKDGTYRGGRRVKAGGKATPVAEQIQNGKKVKLMSNNIPDFEFADIEADDMPDGVELEGFDMPKPSEYLSAKKDGQPLGADEIYKETWLWLKERKCEKLVNKRLIEAYAQAFARYIQCEEAISKYGVLGKHPITGGGLHGKDLSKADVSVNIYAFLKAQETGKAVNIACACGEHRLDVESQY